MERAGGQGSGSVFLNRRIDVSSEGSTEGATRHCCPARGRPRRPCIHRLEGSNNTTAKIRLKLQILPSSIS